MAWASALGAGLSGLLGKLFGPKESTEDRLLKQRQLANMQQGSDMARWGQGQAQALMPRGLDLMTQAQRALGMAEGDLGQLRGYYSPMLGGSRTAIGEAMAPERNLLAQSYQNQQQSASTLAPRTGAGAALYSAAPYGQAGAMTGLMSQARSGAAQGMGQVAGQQANIGGQYGSQGLGTMGAATGMFGAGNVALGGANAAGQGLINSNMTRQQMEWNMALQQGSSFYTMLKPLMKRLGTLFG